MDAKVSIIMAAYKAEATIEQAMDSVLAQTFSDWELLVVNDCSPDQTASVVARYAARDERIILLNNEKNSGVSFTRKRGLEAARGEWIAVLDSDDAWAPDKLEKQLRLADEKGAKLVFTGSAFMDSDGGAIDWQLHVPAVLPYRKLLKQNLISNSSVLVRKELYEKYYLSGDEMHEDFAIWLGITKSGIDAYGIDEPLLIYRLAKTSKSGNKLKAARMNWNTYRRVGLGPVTAFYYMLWYTAKGLRKYGGIRKAAGK